MLFKRREEKIHPEILDLRNGEAFVDVGANVGTYTLQVVSMCCARMLPSRIISIEAHPTNYNALCRNIMCNGFTNVTAINKAVWDKSGSVTIHQRVANNGRVLTDDASLNHSNGSMRLDVEADTLDNIVRACGINNIGIIKMDIEGAEVNALNAARETLKRTRKIIIEAYWKCRQNKRYTRGQWLCYTQLDWT